MQKPRRQRQVGWDTVEPDDLRPAGDGKTCFYCRELLDAKHKPDCVICKGDSYYHVAIVHNPSGEMRRYRFDMRWEDHSDFMWTEGNYSCDCNRHMDFLRAGGVELDKDHVPCGDSLYTCLYAELPDGTRHTLDEKPQ
jgi:hypothetical protein